MLAKKVLTVCSYRSHSRSMQTRLMAFKHGDALGRIYLEAMPDLDSIHVAENADTFFP